MARLAKPVPMTPTLAEAAELWGRSLRAANKSPKTISTYLYATARLAEHIGADRPIDQITRADHERLLAALQEAGWKASSVSTVYRSLRSFWGFVAKHDDLPVARDPMNGMAAVKVPETKIEFLSDRELSAIVATTKSKSRHNYLGNRDRAILLLLATTGARLAEIATLMTGDVDLNLRQVNVMGKGRRERSLPLDDQTYDALRLYLTRQRPRHAMASAPDLWLARAGVMTANGIAQMVAQRGEAAGVERRVHPHELRHRFVAQQLRDGMSEGYVMALTGHRSRAMMDRYGAYTRAEHAGEAFRKLAAARKPL